MANGLLWSMQRLEVAIEGLVDTFQTSAGQLGIRIEELKTLPFWVRWREEETKPGRKTKVPYTPEGHRRASSTDPSCWGTYEAAINSPGGFGLPGMLSGVGLMLGDLPEYDVTLIGIDLDGCVRDGVIEPLAKKIVQRIGSYAEISPSGRGLKIFAALPFSSKNQLIRMMGKSKTGKPRSRVQFAKGNHEEIALDRSPRFYAYTGQRIPYSPTTINLTSLENIDWLLNNVGPSYLGQAPKTQDVKDHSGSGYAFRYVLHCRKRGLTADEALDALSEDIGPAGDWFARVDERQHQRVIDNVQALLDEEEANLAIVFDAHEGWVADDAITRRLNKRHAVVALQGQTKIATFYNTGAIGLGPERDLHTLYANDLVPTPDGKRSEPASKHWIRDAQRRTYPNGIAFLPMRNPPPGTLNLFSGWAVEADARSSCEMGLAHLKHVICSGDEAAFAYVEGYLAHLVQRPWEKPGVALVFQGLKGAGKDSIAEYLARMIGQQYVRAVSNPQHVTGKFNAHLETTLVLNLQEGFWAGNHTQEAVLKQLITSPYVEIERKGVDLASKQSFLRILITTNAEWVVPASADERRYAVFEVSPDRLGDTEYFTDLRSEMDGGGPAALLHHLQTVDLSEFDVRKPAKTDALIRQKIRSLRNVARWWFERLYVGDLCGARSEWRVGSISITRDVLRDDYESWMRAQKHHGETVAPDDFGKRLAKLVVLGESRPRQNAKRPRCYVIPELTSARKQLEVYLDGQIGWDE